MRKKKKKMCGSVHVGHRDFLHNDDTFVADNRVYVGKHIAISFIGTVVGEVGERCVQLIYVSAVWAPVSRVVSKKRGMAVLRSKWWFDGRRRSVFLLRMCKSHSAKDGCGQAK